MPKRAKRRRPLDGDGFGREDLETGGLGECYLWSPLLPVTPLAAHPYTGPHHRLLDNRKGLTTLRGQIEYAVNLNEETQMNNKSITPNPQQPVDRVPTGQLPSALAELSEAALSSEVLPCFFKVPTPGPFGFPIDSSALCSYDGDDE